MLSFIRVAVVALPFHSNRIVTNEASLGHERLQRVFFWGGLQRMNTKHLCYKDGCENTEVLGSLHWG